MVRGEKQSGICSHHEEADDVEERMSQRNVTFCVHLPPLSVDANAPASRLLVLTLATLVANPAREQAERLQLQRKKFLALNACAL